MRLPNRVHDVTDEERVDQTDACVCLLFSLRETEQGLGATAMCQLDHKPTARATSQHKHNNLLGNRYERVKELEHVHQLFHHQRHRTIERR